MMSSVMPSLKYSCSGSPLMLLNGRTMTEGRSVAAGSTGTSELPVPSIPSMRWAVLASAATCGSSGRVNASSQCVLPRAYSMAPVGVMSSTRNGRMARLAETARSTSRRT